MNLAGCRSSQQSKLMSSKPWANLGSLSSASGTCRIRTTWTKVVGLKMQDVDHRTQNLGLKSQGSGLMTKDMCIRTFSLILGLFILRLFLDSRTYVRFQNFSWILELMLDSRTFLRFQDFCKILELILELGNQLKKQNVQEKNKNK